jgi:serine/threonine protein kinase
VEENKPPKEPQVDTAQLRGLREGDEVGNYLILAHLFTGGMGDIYAAVHLQLNRHVALKVPRVDTPAADFNRRRLLAEARCLARVVHANVVAVYDFAATHDRLEYLVMELLDGQSLDHLLVKTPYLQVLHAVRVVKEVARGLAAFHRAGIYHVDLKPENVMVVAGPLLNKSGEGENWIKLIDLGTARLTYERNAEIELPLVGTPAYMSPEMILDRPVDGRADLYALGIVFYEILAGQHPLHSADDAEMLQAQVERRPPPLSTLRPDIPAHSALEKLIIDCLEKQPSKRPSSMIEFLERLDRAQSEWHDQVAQRATLLPGL